MVIQTARRSVAIAALVVAMTLSWIPATAVALELEGPIDVEDAVFVDREGALWTVYLTATATSSITSGTQYHSEHFFGDEMTRQVEIAKAIDLEPGEVTVMFRLVHFRF